MPLTAERQLRRAEALRSLDIAARTYWSRPRRALSFALMLEAYARADLRLEPPLADLGCGTGLFAAALADRGVLDGTDIGLDYALADLRQTARRPRLGIVRGDLAELPFASASLGSVLSNAVLSSFEGNGSSGLEGALAEVRRVLRPGGRLVCSVATPAFVAGTMLYRLARRLGWNELAARIEARISRRNDHTVILERADWVALLERGGLEVEVCRPIMGRGHADLYRWLALVRGGDLTRRLGLARLGPVQGAVQAQLLRLTIGRPFVKEIERLERDDRDRASFLLLVARKG
jgi:SAM-dependent methyltransferase